MQYGSMHAAHSMYVLRIPDEKAIHQATESWCSGGDRPVVLAYIMDPDPQSKVSLLWVKEMFHHLVFVLKYSRTGRG
jgi:hypothetical protein